jgi:hypothetical protein
VPISLLCPIIFAFITTAEIDAFKEAEAADKTKLVEIAGEG